LNDCKAVQHWHTQVDDDQIGQDFPRGVHGFRAIASLEDSMAGLFQNCPDQFPARGFIVSD
jgi:hypothetical protein